VIQMPKEMTHLSLFSGIGGLDLAAEWAGFETVGQCEWADYPTKVLEKHWPDVPRWRDIRTLTKESFYERTGRATVDVISGGFPCQPFSVAGKQKGKEDNRYLWPEMLRVIRELKPHYVVGENVPGIINIAADEVCADLEREGYEVRIFNFEAAAVGAPHRRDRVAFVANAESNRPQPFDRTAAIQGERHGQRPVGGEDIQARPAERRFPQSRLGGMPDGLSSFLDGLRWPAGYGQEQFDWEPPRTAHGIKRRADRIKCLGNAVVPQQFYPIFKAIAELEGI
jgi:DNA (cytosine-5)-methyltransferase 1